MNHEEEIKWVNRFWIKFILAYTLFLMIMLALACSSPEPSNVPSNDFTSGNGHRAVVEIEGCEYFVNTQRHGQDIISHKGNCKSPIHNPNSKEGEDLKAQIAEKDKKIEWLRKKAKDAGADLSK